VLAETLAMIGRLGRALYSHKAVCMLSSHICNKFFSDGIIMGRSFSVALLQDMCLAMYN
jgi:hypothetical protein